MQQQILEANTILESFGNAKTSRNNNSSRFGKFIQINLNKSFKIIGASIVNYLLEKSRVATQAEDERNYHIFYEMVKGCSAEEREKYMIEDDASTYTFLNQSGCTDIEDVHDDNNFEKLKLAFSVLSIPPDDVEGIFKVISAILWLGNIEFAESSSDGVKVSNMDVMEKIQTLLGIDGSRMCEGLCFKKLTIRGETTISPLKHSQAVENRNSIAKAIYDNMFQRIVDYVNRSLSTNTNKVANFLGGMNKHSKATSFGHLWIRGF